MRLNMSLLVAWWVACAGITTGCALPRWSLAPDPTPWHDSASAADQFSVFRDLMQQPLRTQPWIDLLQQRRSGNAADWWSVVTQLARRGRDDAAPHASRASAAPALPPALDAHTLQALGALPEPLSTPLQAQLQAMLQAQRLLDHALREIPADVTRHALMSQPPDAHRLAALAPRVDLPALARGMQLVLDATATLQMQLADLARRGQLPPLVWRHPTAQGWIHLDTTGKSQAHAPNDVWLWIKVGGDDTYQLDAFHGLSDRRAVRVLLDTSGSDRYEANTAGGDAAAGVLGLSLHWDGETSDADVHNQWSCTRWCQGSGLLGAAALVHAGRGKDVMRAQTQAQAYALGGLALLADAAAPAAHQTTRGHTRYEALSDAQGSAGPSGVALLVDTQGHDRYTLAAQPLVAPSSQLPDRNASMGQGAGRGWLLRSGDGSVTATAGGVGVLMDLQGDDHYSAQVFAQGAGYQQGLGLLLDAGGHNEHTAAWYALGAAAHGAAGIFVASGHGNDRYNISHVTALGAGHDASLGWFEDRGGDDGHTIADMGLGVGSDGGTGVFINTSGNDCVRVTGTHGRVMGQHVWVQKRPGGADDVRAGSGIYRGGPTNEASTQAGGKRNVSTRC